MHENNFYKMPPENLRGTPKIQVLVVRMDQSPSVQQPRLPILRVPAVMFPGEDVDLIGENSKGDRVGKLPHQTQSDVGFNNRAKPRRTDNRFDCKVRRVEETLSELWHTLFIVPGGIP